MEYNEIIICRCHSLEHQILFSWDDDIGENVYMSIHLNKLPFWNRVKYAIKYIFGRQSRYGAFDEVILKPQDYLKINKVTQQLYKSYLSHKASYGL